MLRETLWCLSAGVMFFSNPAAAQSPKPKTVLDGIYTDAQAKRGETAYNSNCAGCHGEDLTGRVMGPLRGDAFLNLWREDGLEYLFTHIKTRMPGNAPGSLPDATYLDVLAYILQVNTFPSGSAELTPGSVADIRFVGLGGPKPLSTNTLVRVAGCFAGSGARWTLTQATEPAKTHDAEKNTPEELKSAAAEPLGSQTFNLQNLEDLPPPFKAGDMLGHKVLAKGVLIRRPGNDSINVISIENLSPSCHP
ncbi:MAG: cytochrome c [Acidobacteriia bacterium]|nr:cytochrome c [Terriglobia bacterium]